MRELADLWLSQGKHDQSDEATGVLRACSMTLVVVTEAGDESGTLGETIAALMPEHPARAIIVRLAGAGERKLEERVYQQCWMPFGQRRQICCEQVEITASDDVIADLPPVLLPLAVADLPVIVWCRSPRFIDNLEIGHKVIVDSALFPVSRLHLSADYILADLSWTRLTRWRQMLAQVFQNHDTLAALDRISRVTVRHPGATPTSSSLYLGTWVKDCLPSVELKYEEGEWSRAGDAPLVISIRLEGEGISVELARQDDRMVTTVNGLAQCSNLPVVTEYSLMREELGLVRHDPTFERILGKIQ
ncbi:MAG TPA: glucose-6-phosphate dehydrogenase assembly protein OpcA [Candidatus Sulfopaludibacter sp.]|nr:glucose-6-phosphate dehydrogenase assembly protein OpcA [Candidatus Sulfopaludibacter sp.]